MSTYRKADKVRLDLYRKPELASPPVLIKSIWYFVNYLIFNSFLPFPNKFKSFLLKAFGAKIGSGVIIKPRVVIKSPWTLTIGDYTWIGECCWIDNHVRVSIGSHCCISQGVYIFTGNHNYNDETFSFFAREINIEDGVWVGAKAMVAPGAFLESMSVVGAGRLVSKRLPAGLILK